MKQIKRIANLLLVLFISISIFSCVKFNFSISTKISVATKSEAQEVIADNYGDNLVSLTGDVFTFSKYALPKVDDKLHGFNVDAIYDYDYRNAKLVMMTHEKSGAKAFLISNDDEDKSAIIGFNTLAFDDRGIPHVFEHACLGGSGKYPNGNIFEDAVNKTYQTYMNAFTMQNATVYPCSSLSDKQLFELFKFYFDGVMDPDVLREEKNLEREAYRYSLYEKNDDIVLSGVVYSEMSAIEGSIDNVAYYNSLKNMFNESFMASNTGGATSEVIKIKNEDLINYHDKYYHPSNMVITLYGDIDYEKYLKYADEEYLSKFDKKEIEKSDNAYKKQDGFSIKKYDFPVSSDDEVEGQSRIVYSMVCEGMTPYESGLFTVATTALFKSNGPIERRLNEKLPNAKFSYDSGLNMPKPFILINFTNVNESDADTIKELVDEAIIEVLENGISKYNVDEIADRLETDKENAKDSHGFARTCLGFYLRVFSNNGEDLLGELRYLKGLDDIGLAYEKGDIDKLIKKYLSNRDAFSMTVIVPKKGLLEEKNSALAKDLKEMKAFMNDEQINELILKTKKFDEWIEYQSENSIVGTLRVASVSSLDEYRASCYAYEETNEGIHFIRSDIKDIKTNYFNILFDASGVKFEDIHKLNFISELLCELPTTNYEGKKLEEEIHRYASSCYGGLTVKHYDGGGYKPYFSYSMRSLDKNIDKVFELLEEMMYETKFEDVDIARSRAYVVKNTLRQSVLNDPSQYLESIIKSQNDSDFLYDYYVDGPEYLKFLDSVVNMSDEEIKTLLTEGRELLLSLYNRSGLVCEIISNYDTMRTVKSKIIELSYDFNDERIQKVDYSENLVPLKNKIAVVCNGTVQYNYVSIPMQKNEIEYSSKYKVLGSVIDNEILYPEFRAKRSVYGSYSTFDRIHSCLYTYRDPNLKESYDVFKTVPKLLKELKISSDDFEDYKLNAYATFSYPLTKFDAARIAIEETLTKTKVKRPDRYVGYMRDIKNFSMDDLKETYEIIDKMAEEGKYLTAGSRELIESNKDMFDEIIYDYVQ